MMTSDRVIETKDSVVNKMRSLTAGLWHILMSRKKLLGIIVASYVAISLIAHNQSVFTFAKLKPSSLMAEFSQNVLLNAKPLDEGERVDVHIEDPTLGHTGEVRDEYTDVQSPENITRIAIGGAITSKKAKGLTDSNRNLEGSLQVFTTFLPSFCSTVSPGYDFQFYFGYDHNDAAFSSPNFTRAFAETFRRMLEKNCPKGLKADLHLVQCSHAGKPTWAQNDAMLEAYVDGVDYFYRINDDTRLQTSGWVEEFVKTLWSYDPPNIGVVGPRHSGGNTNILTYDFVHRTHVDIFGFYYPKLFTDWWGDDWITLIYRPGRSKKLDHIRLAHTMTLGQRYHTDHSVGNKLQGRLAVDKITLNRYLERINRTSSAQNSSGQKMVISMTLYGKNPRYTWGAIRNVQLTPIVFPGWTMRFYVPHPRHFPQNLTVPVRIIRKLKRLGAEVVFVNSSEIPPKYWSHGVTMNPDVSHFLIRHVDCRISDRDFAVVNEWLEKFNDSAVHCIRDHRDHALLPIVGGLWGGNTKKFNEILHDRNLLELVNIYLANATFLAEEFLGDNRNVSISSSKTNETFSSFEHFLWKRVTTGNIVCHDSVSCDKWNYSVSFPVERTGGEFLGQKFDERQEPIGSFTSRTNESFPKCDVNRFLILRTNTSKG